MVGSKQKNQQSISFNLCWFMFQLSFNKIPAVLRPCPPFYLARHLHQPVLHAPSHWYAGYRLTNSSWNKINESIFPSWLGSLRPTLNFMIPLDDLTATSSTMPCFVNHSNVGLIVLLDRQRVPFAQSMVHLLRKLNYLMPPLIFGKIYSYLSYFLTLRPFVELVVLLSSHPICSFCASKLREVWAMRKAFSDILIPI